MSFNAKSEILSAIAKTDDPAMKTVLLLLLGVFEEIGTKIDNVLNNDQALRQTVLNGHEPVHHEHHEWVARQIRIEKEQQEDNRKIRTDLLTRTLWWLLRAAGLLMATGAGVMLGRTLWK